MRFLCHPWPLLLALICLTTVQSCLSDIEFDEGNSLPLVVECVLHKTQTQNLTLYRMGSLYSSLDRRPVEDAQITLLQSNKVGAKESFTPVATFNRTGQTQWSVDYEPEYGKLYKLQVITSDKDTLTAQTRFPFDQKLVGWSRYLKDTHQHLGEDAPKTSYRITSYEIRNGSKKYLTYLSTNGVVDKDYHHIVYEHPSLQACKMWIFPHTDGTPVDSECLNNPIEVDEGVFKYYKDYYFHSEAFDYKGSAHPYAKLIATDHPSVDGFNTTEGVVSSLEWCNRPLNRNGDLNCSQWTRILTPDLPLHSSFLRIDQPADFTRFQSAEELKKSYLSTNRSFLIIADYDPENYQSILDCTNEVHFVSDEYDSYLRDLYTRKRNDSNFILSTYDSSDMYSNIDGGVGIFGADNITWDMIDIFVARGTGIYYEYSDIEI